MNLYEKFNYFNKKSNLELQLFFHSLSKNQIIKIIDKFYYQSLITCINLNLINYNNLPINNLDIYNEFLADSAIFVNKYNPKINNASFKTFLIGCCKKFCLNKIKYWLAKSRSFSSKLISFDNESFYFLEDKNAKKEILKYNDICDIKEMKRKLNNNELIIWNQLENENITCNFWTAQKINNTKNELFKKANWFFGY
ncbi:hypothetical protein [Mycoplasmopsis lipofaciens]|uniref:hypothetical protein n=1 Tax=Mycoplasmopsis lipofaciens TaxID=114884 RepID=UPI000482AB31|nr:hypothetical protein [Mycoplasmopsis lipofaciens]